MNEQEAFLLYVALRLLEIEWLLLGFEGEETA